MSPLVIDACNCHQSVISKHVTSNHFLYSTSSGFRPTSVVQSHMRIFIPEWNNIRADNDSNRSRHEKKEAHELLLFAGKRLSSLIKTMVPQIAIEHPASRAPSFHFNQLHTVQTLESTGIKSFRKRAIHVLVFEG